MKKKGNKKIKYFNVIFKYLKDEKFRLILYVMLVVLTYVPVLLSSFFWGYAIDALIHNLFNKFIIFLLLREGMHILFYSVLAIPRDSIYNHFITKVF